MGLFVDMMDPEEMMMGAGENDPDLEAELASITGSKAVQGGRNKQKEKSECLLFLLPGTGRQQRTCRVYCNECILSLRD